MRSRILLPALAALALVGQPARAAQDAAARDAAPVVAVRGTAFLVPPPGGGAPSEPARAGAVIALEDARGGTLALRIDTVERDRRDPELFLYALSGRAAGTDAAWAPLCAPGADGRRLGFPLAEARSPDGRQLPPSEGAAAFGLACTSGAIGKCVLLGYAPWRGLTLQAAHQACVRLLRADYCGDGEGTTRDGTPVDVVDRLRVHTPDPSAAAMAFEAAWGPDGAVCVARTRVPENVTLGALAVRCPRLRGRLGPGELPGTGWGRAAAQGRAAAEPVLTRPRPAVPTCADSAARARGPARERIAAPPRRRAAIKPGGPAPDPVPVGDSPAAQPSSSARASRRSRVSKPSVNHP
jgi:hypothetical protein